MRQNFGSRGSQWVIEDYQKNDSLKLAMCCLRASAMIPSSDVTQAFLILADNKPDHEKIPELSAYYEHTYIGDRRRPGRNERYGSDIFPVEMWNHFETTSEGITRTTNSTEAWHYGIQELFNVITQHLRTFMKGLEKDIQMQPTAFVSGVSGLKPFAPERYQTMKRPVEIALAPCLFSEISVCLHSIAYLSY